MSKKRMSLQQISTQYPVISRTTPINSTPVIVHLLKIPSVETQFTQNINTFFINAFANTIGISSQQTDLASIKLLDKNPATLLHFCANAATTYLNSHSPMDLQIALWTISRKLFTSLHHLYETSINNPKNKHPKSQEKVRDAFHTIWEDTNTKLYTIYKSLKKELKKEGVTPKIDIKHIYSPLSDYTTSTQQTDIYNLLDPSKVRQIVTHIQSIPNGKKQATWNAIAYELKHNLKQDTLYTHSEVNTRIFLASYLNEIPNDTLRQPVTTPETGTRKPTLDELMLKTCKKIIDHFEPQLWSGRSHNDVAITQLAKLLLGNSTYNQDRLVAATLFIKNSMGNSPKTVAPTQDLNAALPPQIEASLTSTSIHSEKNSSSLKMPSQHRENPVAHPRILPPPSRPLQNSSSYSSVSSLSGSEDYDFEDDEGYDSEHKDVPQPLASLATQNSTHVEKADSDRVQSDVSATRKQDTTTTEEPDLLATYLRPVDKDEDMHSDVSDNSRKNRRDSASQPSIEPAVTPTPDDETIYSDKTKSLNATTRKQASQLPRDVEEDDTSMHSEVSFQPHTSGMHQDASNNMILLDIYAEEQSGTHFELTTSPQNSSPVAITPLGYVSNPQKDTIDSSSEETTPATPQPQQTQNRRISMLGFKGVNTGRKARADQQLARLNLLNYATNEELLTIVPDKEAGTIRAELNQELSSINSCTNIANKYKLINAASTKYTISDALADTLRGRETTVSPAASSSITPEQVEGPASNDTVKATLSTKYTGSNLDDPLSDKELGDLNWIIDCMEAFVAKKENEILNPPKKENTTSKSFFGQLFSQKEKSEPHTPTLASIKSNPTINGQSYERHLLENLKGKSNTKDKLATAILLANRYGIQLFNPEKTQNMGRTPTSDPIGEDSDTEYGEEIEEFLDREGSLPSLGGLPPTSTSKLSPHVTDSNDEKPSDTEMFGSELRLGSQGQKFAFAAAKEQQEEVSVPETTDLTKLQTGFHSERRLTQPPSVTRSNTIAKIHAATLPKHFIKAYNDLQDKANTLTDKNLAERLKRTLILVDVSTDIADKLSLIRSAAVQTGIAIEEPTPGDRKTDRVSFSQPSPTQSSSASATAEELPPSDEQTTLSPAAQETLKQLVKFQANAHANKLLQAIGELDNVQARETLLGSEQCKDLLAKLEREPLSDTPAPKETARRGSTYGVTESDKAAGEQHEKLLRRVNEELAQINARQPESPNDTVTREDAKEVATPKKLLKPRSITDRTQEDETDEIDKEIATGFSFSNTDGSEQTSQDAQRITDTKPSTTPPSSAQKEDLNSPFRDNTQDSELTFTKSTALADVTTPEPKTPIRTQWTQSTGVYSNSKRSVRSTTSIVSDISNAPLEEQERKELLTIIRKLEIAVAKEEAAAAAAESTSKRPGTQPSGNKKAGVFSRLFGRKQQPATETPPSVVSTPQRDTTESVSNRELLENIKNQENNRSKLTSAKLLAQILKIELPQNETPTKGLVFPSSADRSRTGLTPEDHADLKKIGVRVKGDRTESIPRDNQSTEYVMSPEAAAVLRQLRDYDDNSTLASEGYIYQEDQTPEEK